MEKIQEKKLKRFIKELSAIRGRHTELVSVFIPAGYDLNKIINHLQQEQGTASNIKDAKTRKNVIDSLEKLIRHLRLYEKTPENGLAAFSGNTAAQEGKVDINVWSIELPEPLNFRLYRCDQTFVLGPLSEMLEHKESYGLIVLDKREGDVALLKGTAVISIRNLTSGVPGKVHTGGQSQARYARLREGAAKEFYKRIGAAANKEFLEMKELKGILVGGPGHSKEEFLAEGDLNTQLKEKIIAIQDLSYTGESGLKELVNKSQDVLAKEEIIKEKRIVIRFLELLAKNPEKVAYGKDEVKKALEYGAVEVLLISESVEDEIAEDFEKNAENYKTELMIISTDTEEGTQLKNLGGIAAILRYAIS